MLKELSSLHGAKNAFKNININEEQTKWMLKKIIVNIN